MKDSRLRAGLVWLRKNKWAWLVFSVLALIVVAVTGGLKGEEVDLVRVVRGDVSEQVVETGYVEAAEKEVVYCTQAGMVKELLVERGQQVKKGQVLAVLENPDLSVQAAESLSLLEQAEASLRVAMAARDVAWLEVEEAKKGLDRLGQLYEVGAVSQEEWEKAQVQVKTWEKILAQREAELAAVLAKREGIFKSLKETQTKKEQLIIKSPLDGEIIFLAVTKNQVVAPGTMVAEIGKRGMLKVTAEVAAEEVEKIQVGQKAHVKLAGRSSRAEEGEVVEIYPKAEERQSALGVVQRKVPVVVRLKQAQGLKPGYEVRVSIITQNRHKVLVLPKTAVVSGEDGTSQVMKVVDGRVRFQKVITGLEDDERIEIVKGLIENDLVVMDGNLALKEGQRIRPSRSSKL